MLERLKTQSHLVLPILLWAILSLLLKKIFWNAQLNDPDIFYHVALAREYPGIFPPKTISQITGIGWNEFFLEKEFLFHRITRFAYFLKGEHGLRALPFIFFFLMSLILILIGNRELKAKTSISTIHKSILLAAIPLPIVLTPYILYRFSLVRPHTFAIPLYLLFAYFYFKKEFKQATVFGALFCLSYHAWHLLTLPFLVLLLEPDFKKNLTASFKALLFSILAGFILNPYFPAPVIAWWLHLKIPFSIALGSENPLNFGNELYPLNTVQLFLQLSSTFFFGSLIFKVHSKLTPLLTLSLGFSLLSFISPRALEYSVPLLSLALAGSVLELSYFKLNLKDRTFVAFTTCSFLALLSFNLKNTRELILDRIKNKPAFTEMNDHPLAKAAQAFPEDAKGLVWNCEWDHSPYLFYARPRLHSLDIMDPSFLYDFSKGTHSARDEMNLGRITDLAPYLKDHFKVDYVFCSNSNVSYQLARDERFLPYFSLADETAATSKAFKVQGRNNANHFITELELKTVRLKKIPSNDELSRLDWQNGFQKTNSSELTLSQFKKFETPSSVTFPLKQLLIKQKEDPSTSAACVQLKIDLNQLKSKSKPATQWGVALGGGPTLQVSSAEKLIYQSVQDLPLGKLFHTWLRLDHLKSDLRVITCFTEKDKSVSFTLASYSLKELYQFCKSRFKTTSYPAFGEEGVEWGGASEVCLL